MKKLLFLLSIVVIFSVSLPALAQSGTDALNYFSMGYYYLYNNELQMARNQFKLCLRQEKNPPTLLYVILSEISNLLGEGDEAENYALMALELDPENESALQIMALNLTQKGQYLDAVPYLEKLLNKQPGNLQLLYYLAEAYTVLENDDKLIDIYRKILLYRPYLVDVALSLGYLYTKRGAFFLAEKEYNRVLELDPENEKALFYLTYIYLSEGKTTEALTFFKKLDDKNLLNDETLEDYASNLFIEDQNPIPALKRIKNKDSLSNTTKAILLYFDDNLAEAQRLFEMSVKKDPNSIVAVFGLVKIAERNRNIDMEKKWRFVLAGNYYNLTLFEKSLNEALQVKQIDPEFIENRYLLGDIYGSLGLTEKAIGEYEYFRDNADEKGDVHIKLGIGYDEMGDHEGAIRNFSAALESFPDNEELHYFLGIEYRIIKDYRNAVKSFKRAVELNDKNAFYFFNLGVSYERLGVIDEAIVYLDKSIQIDDTNATALNYLGYLLADMGIRLNEAEMFIQKALAMDPENGAYLDSMGWVYYKLSEYEKAQEYMESAVQYIDMSDEENYLIYDHLGDVYYKIGLLKEAIEAWEEALKMKYVKDIELKIKKVREEMYP